MKNVSSQHTIAFKQNEAASPMLFERRWDAGQLEQAA